MYSLTFRVRLSRSPLSPLCCHVRGLPIRAALCYHSNETRAPIPNPPSSAQLGCIPYHSPKLYPGPCSSVGMRPQADRQTDRHTTDTDTRVSTIHFPSSMTHAKCNYRVRIYTNLSRFVFCFHILTFYFSYK